MKTSKPAYLALYEALRDEILSGVRPLGSRLPSRRVLARDRGVSAITAEHCIELLCEEGYAVFRDLGDEVDDPGDDVSESRRDKDDPHDKRQDVFGLGVPDYAVDPADYPAEEYLQDYFSDLRKAFILFGDHLKNVLS